MTEKRSARTRELLIKHTEKYPQLRAEDIFKYIFQSVFGCEHMVSNESAVLARIRREYAQMTEFCAPPKEALDGKYSRVHLSCISDGLKPETLARLFFLSAKKFLIL